MVTSVDDGDVYLEASLTTNVENQSRFSRWIRGRRNSLLPSKCLDAQRLRTGLRSCIFKRNV